MAVKIPGEGITSVRDRIKVKLTETAAGKLTRRSLRYDAGFLLMFFAASPLRGLAATLALR